MKTISYKPLFKMLVDRDITKAQLRNMCGYSTAAATKLIKAKRSLWVSWYPYVLPLTGNIEDVLTFEPVSE